GETTIVQCSTFWMSGIRASNNARVSARVLNIFQFPAILGRLILLDWGFLFLLRPIGLALRASGPLSVLLFDQASAGPPMPLSVSTTAPGSFCPDKDSKDAPLPVETCVILDATPDYATAAAELPRPTDA